MALKEQWLAEAYEGAMEMWAALTGAEVAVVARVVVVRVVAMVAVVRGGGRRGWRRGGGQVGRQQAEGRTRGRGGKGGRACGKRGGRGGISAYLRSPLAQRRQAQRKRSAPYLYLDYHGLRYPYRE